MSLQIKSVSKTYRTRSARIRALEDVTLSVDRGEVVALVGNNGAGKSTLMSITAGLLSADVGTVTVMGDETTAGGGTPSPHLGLAPQEEAVYPTLTVRANLAYFGTLAGLRGRLLEDRVEEVAGELLLGDLLGRKAVELSGGQRRRLHTGLALMHAPEVLLLDEPTVGVDIDARLALLAFVRDLAQRGAAVLYSTHQMIEVEQVASKAVVLHEGRVLAIGAVEEIVSSHAVPSAELRFMDDHDMARGALGETFGTRVLGLRRAGQVHTVAEIRLDRNDAVVADVVEILPRSLRETLVSAEIRECSFEQAYVHLVRSVGGSPEVDVVADVGTEVRG